MKFSHFESGDDLREFRIRISILVGIVFFVAFIWLGRLFFMQVVFHGYYDRLAQGNRIRVIPQEGPRGFIYDRTGKILAYNRPVFHVNFIREDSQNLQRTLVKLSQLTGIPLYQLRQQMQAQKSTPAFRALRLLENIPRTTADIIESHHSDIPGISVEVELKRFYPTTNTHAHVVGYVGATTDNQRAELERNQHYSGRVVGQTGLEAAYNSILLGKDGGRQVEVDHRGRELRVLDKPVKAEAGLQISTSIHTGLQSFARSLLGKQQGAILVSHVNTGEILAMVSGPDYDPNRFVQGIDKTEWEKMTENKQAALINRTIQGLYPPGSTFKLVLALAGLEEGIIQANSTFHCPGYYNIGKERRYCWLRSGHGTVNLRQAIERSCNVFFYNLGTQLKGARIAHYSTLLGFGQTSGLELLNEKKGLVPNPQWKENALGQPWFYGDDLNFSIGQGYLNVTPIQLLRYIQFFASKGNVTPPTLQYSTVKPELRQADFVKQEHLELIRQGMLDAVNGSGTARRARTPLFQIAGKTGTAQVVGQKSRKRNLILPHSIFLGYAPAEAAQLSVVVVVEHGNEGGKVAAPMASKMLLYYHQHIKPLNTTAPPQEKSFASQIEKTFISRDGE